jgi:hypothetical protein
MENKNKNYTRIIICIILAIILGAFWFYSSKPKAVDNVLPPITEQKPADNPVVTDTAQSGKIDEHLTINNELRDVNFCGKTYKVKQVMIDGVDVVQRIAEILTKNLVPETLKIGPYGPKMDEWKTIENKNGEITNGICENIKNTTTETIEIGVGKFKSTDIFPEGIGEIYTVSIEESFRVVYTTGDIYTTDAYSGGFVGPIGKLK